MASEMPLGWYLTTLGDCSDWYSGGTPNTEVSAYWGGAIPWITASSLHDFYVTDSERRVTALGIQNGTRLMPRDTILFVVRGMSLKSEFRVGISRRPLAFGQDCKAIIAHRDVEPLFLANVLRAKAPEIMGLVDEASHGTGRLQTEALKGLEILLPPLPEQRAIAHILSSLDDKIELNRRMNATLEEMAQALFQAWFVDFAPVRAKLGGQETGLPQEIADLFPAALVASEVGEIPEGWTRQSILAYADLLSGGTPSTSITDYWDGDIPWVSAKDVSVAQGLFVLDTDRKITTAGVEHSSTKLLPKYTTIVTARGTVGAYCLLGRGMAMNQTNYGIKAKLGNSDLFVYFSLANLVNELKRNAYGTIFDTVTTKTFASTSIVRPTDEIIACFDQQASPLMERILLNQQESRTLAALRDALLPKLVSGEVRVSDIASEAGHEHD